MADKRDAGAAEKIKKIRVKLGKFFFLNCDICERLLLSLS